MVSDPGFLGDPLVKIQHLLGATQWEQLSETEVIGHHQLRAAHNRFTDLTLQRVDRRGMNISIRGSMGLGNLLDCGPRSGGMSMILSTSSRELNLRITHQNMIKRRRLGSLLLAR